MTNIAPITAQARPGLCILAGAADKWTGRIRRLSACGAFVETGGRPEVGTQVALAHPEVGAIVAHVSSHGRGGVALGFELTEESSAFAFAVHAHDMTRAA